MNITTTHSRLINASYIAQKCAYCSALCHVSTAKNGLLKCVKCSALTETAESEQFLAVEIQRTTKQRINGLDMSPRARFKRAYRRERQQPTATRLTSAMYTGPGVPPLLRYERAAINALYWREQRLPYTAGQQFVIAKSLSHTVGRDLWDCIHFLRGY